MLKNKENEDTPATDYLLPKGSYAITVGKSRHKFGAKPENRSERHSTFLTFSANYVISQ